MEVVEVVEVVDGSGGSGGSGGLRGGGAEKSRFCLRKNKKRPRVAHTQPFFNIGGLSMKRS